MNLQEIFQDRYKFQGKFTEFAEELVSLLNSIPEDEIKSKRDVLTYWHDIHEGKHQNEMNTLEILLEYSKLP